MQIPNINVSSSLQLELESKVIEPSKQLLNVLEANFNTLTLAVKRVLTEFQNSVIETGKQFYDQPQQTLTAWFDQAIAKSTELSNSMNNETIPELEIFYQSNLTQLELFNEHWMANVKQAALSSSNYAVSFYENPVAMSAQLYAQIEQAASQFSALGLEWFNQFKAALILIYQASVAAINVFFDAPMATVEGLYYQTVSSLLDLYASLIGATLDVLGNSVPAII